MKTLCIYGCGGMGRELADLAYRISKWEEIIFVDDNIKERVINEIKVYTLEEVLGSFRKNNIEFIVSVGEPSLRKELYEKLFQQNLEIISIITPELELSRFTLVEKGTIIHTGSVITCNVYIGQGCLINKHVVIGHDVNIGDYSVISPNVTIGGNVNIGNGCFIGSGAIIRNGIKIGENSIIGMGTNVLHDVAPNSVMVGNPARYLRENTEKRVFQNR